MDGHTRAAGPSQPVLQRLGRLAQVVRAEGADAPVADVGDVVVGPGVQPDQRDPLGSDGRWQQLLNLGVPVPGQGRDRHGVEPGILAGRGAEAWASWVRMTCLASIPTASSRPVSSMATGAAAVGPWLAGRRRRARPTRRHSPGGPPRRGTRGRGPGRWRCRRPATVATAAAGSHRRCRHRPSARGAARSRRPSSPHGECCGEPPGRYALSAGTGPPAGPCTPGRQRAGDGGWLSSSTCRGTA